MLSRRDAELVVALREAAVLQDVRERLLDQKDGVILISCSDGDRFCDIFLRQVHMQSSCRHDPRIHVFAWHGGALACAPCCPINESKNDNRVFLRQISQARKMKGINLVALYAHAPCGAAGGTGLSLEEVFAFHFRAKMQIKTLNQGIQVIPFFHVDHGNGRQRTYFLSRTHWETWAERHRVRAIA
jgi:hypothetical protein